MAELPIKVIGKRFGPPSSAEEAHSRALVLQAQADQLNPFPKPRGFVFKAKSYAQYEEWRRRQTNPRLW